MVWRFIVLSHVGVLHDSFVAGCPFAGFAVRCRSLCLLALVVWSILSSTRVSTADCASGEVRPGFGGDVIAEAVGVLSLA